MKTRNGFVSNSSSSSFIVMWDRKPESWQEVKNVLFPGIDSIADGSSDSNVSTSKISQTVFNDTREAKEYEIKDENNFYCTFWTEHPEWIEKGYNWETFETEMSIVEKLVSKTKGRYELNSEIRNIQFSNKNIDINIDRKNKFGKFVDDSGELNPIEKKYNDLKSKAKEIEIIEEEIDNMYVIMEKKSSEMFFKDYAKKYIAIYEYGDDVYEHGDIFNKLDHIKSSHH